MKNKNKVVYYESGDELTFTIAGHREKIKDQIKLFIGDSIIVFNQHNIDVRQIDGVYVDKKNKVWYFLKYKLSKLFLFAGTGYLLLDVINTGELSEQTLLISGSLITAGVLAKLLISKRIKVRKGGKKLRILNI
ncbi:MAG TPA: hypothetical protein VIT44_09725 [Cyclobacteriaceae bacterium]